jgi:dihydrodipicolinate synthase/N-acetylneuraminate lyase
MKDTSGDAVSLTNLIVSKGDRIQAFNGWDSLTFVGMSLGAKASVWGMAGFIPELAVELWNTLARDKNLEGGRELWAKLWPIADFVESVNYVAAVKAAHELIGSPAGPVRPPVLPLSGEDRETLRSLLQAAGVKTV